MLGYQREQAVVDDRPVLNSEEPILKQTGDITVRPLLLRHSGRRRALLLGRNSFAKLLHGHTGSNQANRRFKTRMGWLLGKGAWLVNGYHDPIIVSLPGRRIPWFKILDSDPICHSRLG